jgi:hypothetical protein
LSTKTEVVWICDFCSTEDPDAVVTTHTLVIDGEVVEAEACVKCWGRYRGALVTFVATGRKIKATRSAKKIATAPKVDAVPFPGLSWRFSSHALLRMGQRKLDPVQVALAAEKPQTIHPGKDNHSAVHIRGKLKVTIDTDRRVIITCANRNEVDEEVAAS